MRSTRHRPTTGTTEPPRGRARTRYDPHMDGVILVFILVAVVFIVIVALVVTMIARGHGAAGPRDDRFSFPGGDDPPGDMGDRGGD